MTKSTLGTRLMNQTNEDGVTVLRYEFSVQTSDDITAALDELIEVGARMRRLVVGTERVARTEAYT